MLNFSISFPTFDSNGVIELSILFPISLETLLASLFMEVIDSDDFCINSPNLEFISVVLFNFSDTSLTFRGKLTVHDTVEGVGCAEIFIMEEDRSFLKDDLLVSGATNNDGTFAIDWLAKQKDFWDNKLQIYAEFKGFDFHPKDCPYVSGSLRDDVRNMLNKLEEQHPGTKFSILKGADNLDKLIGKKFNSAKLYTCNKCGEVSPAQVCKVCELLGGLK